MMILMLAAAMTVAMLIATVFGLREEASACASRPATAASAATVSTASAAPRFPLPFVRE